MRDQFLIIKKLLIFVALEDKQLFIVETKDISLRTLLYVLLILIIFIVNIFVAKLSSTTTSEDLQALFSEHGSVSSAKVIMDKETGNSKCFGFVEMEDETEGFNAINALNETEFQGRKIVVKKARPREEGGDDRGQRFPRERRFNSNR